MATTASQKVCVVVGLGGNGIGDHVARKFASQGYKVALLARTEANIKKVEDEINAKTTETGGSAAAYVCDAADRVRVNEVVGKIGAQIDTVIYNAGSGVFKAFAELSAEEFEGSWKCNVLGAFNVAKAVIPVMEKQGSGVMGFTGATASWRGMPFTPGFAPAKFGLRAFSQALARDYGPKNIHVFHAVIDGIVEMPKTRQWMPNKPTEQFLDPVQIAETYWYLANQDKRCWSTEVNVAPGAVMDTMASI
eukprot:g10497.t1